jgi:hypothetical protein
VPRRLRVSLVTGHVMVGEGQSSQIGLELAIGDWRGAASSSSSGRPSVSIRLRFQLHPRSQTLHQVHHTQQHTNLRREKIPVQHGSSQAHHQGDGASHGRAVCLSILYRHVHVLTPSDSVPGIEAIPHDDNLRYFDVKIHGPSQSPYEGIRIQLWPTRSLRL